ncbi:septal ring lytic transglycosylase RlpA family protein [Aphanothece hegewaldii]|uniref:septal ring lytic transglycosylase RlpA family protein n=1 Tax=Aphanothece hegewaldii TaxID=1521625 RepID=UPI001FED2052|nr:septal ring lytic transglycosylase RlpA family protein [Aphanothece hegewaldii]
MKRKIWNQFTTTVLTTVIGTTISLVSSAEATFGSSSTDLVAKEQSTTESTLKSTTETQSTTVDLRNNFAPSQNEPNSKSTAIESSESLSTFPAVPEPETLTKPTNDAVPVSKPQPKQTAVTTPISNINAAPTKKTQPTRINSTTVPSKAPAKVSSRPQTAQTKSRVAARKQGMASWYGPGFHGRRTANGESFNQHGMTAAHRTLPIGTRVKVTNLNNGRSVVVRINDRGPFSGGRIIDLSKGAARLIGVMQSGVAPVLLEVLGR